MAKRPTKLEILSPDFYEKGVAAYDYQLQRLREYLEPAKDSDGNVLNADIDTCIKIMEKYPALCACRDKLYAQATGEELPTASAAKSQKGESRPSAAERHHSKTSTHN